MNNKNEHGISYRNQQMHRTRKILKQGLGLVFANEKSNRESRSRRYFDLLHLFEIDPIQILSFFYFIE